MEQRKLLNNSTVSKFLIRIYWIEVNDLPNEQCSVCKNTRFKTPKLRSDLCNYSDTYVVVKGRRNFIGPNNVTQEMKSLPLGIMLHLGPAYRKSITHT